MPEIRYYVVEQTREIKVTANDLVDAIRIANASFRGEEKPEDVWGNPSSAIKETDVHAREAY